MSGDSTDSALRYFAHSEVRPSQIDMVKDGMDALLGDGFLLASAPTGIGKTAAALASAIAAQRTSTEHLRILFLTGRQSQHKIVVDTVNKINQQMPNNEGTLRLVDLIGREGMCRNVDRMSGKCDCEENLDGNLREELRADVRSQMFRQSMHVDEVIRVSRRIELCPWATAREAAKSCDILVCDYNHVFIDNVREASLPPMGIELENCILIVDEAHNLPDRVRNGLERRAIAKIFRDSRFEVQEHLEREQERASQSAEETDLDEMEWVEKALKRLENDMPIWFSAREKELSRSNSDDMRIETTSLLDEIDAILNESIEGTNSTPYSSLRRLVKQLFLVKVESNEDDENEKETSCERLGALIATCDEYKDSPALVLVFDKILDEPRVRSFLLDPGVISGRLFGICKGSILMSGTLFPPKMYADLLRIPDDRPLIIKEYSSPFLSERRPVLIAQNATSRYTERGFQNTENIRNHIAAVIRNTPGHVALFAQSYAMLEQILEDDNWIPWGVRIEKERARMSKRDVGEMIQRLYQRRRTKDRVLICGALSGKLAEGVDYPENILDAVICVGLPVPPPSARQDALREYCQDKFGRDLAGRYSSHQPAVNSLLQAIGRPIRKAEDRALVVILEKRVLQRPYKFCVPDSLQVMKTPDSERTARLTKRFFERFPEPAIEVI